MVEPGYVVEGFLPWSLAWLAPYIGAFILALAYIAGSRNDKLYWGVSLVSILASAIISTIAAARVLGGEPIYAKASGYWFPWIKVTLGTYIDGLSAVMALVVSWLSFLIALYSVKYMEGDWGLHRYFFFITFFVGSMQLVVLADNLLLLFIGWEGTGIASYALIGHWYTDEEEYWVGVPGRRALGQPMYFEPSHSAVRAILFTRIGDIGLLVGTAIIYLTVGTITIPELVQNAAAWIGALAAKGILPSLLLIFTLGALGKSAQFPFHEWLVTAMTGPTPVSALIHAATMVKAGVYFILRFAPIIIVGALAAGEAAKAQALDYFTIVAGLGAVTAFMMATMALVSNELKLILAYSTASQLGYMFIAGAAAGIIAYHGELEAALSSVMAGLSHLVSHAVFKASLFLIAGWLIHVAHNRFIDTMGNYAKYMKLTAFSLWLAGLSLAGLPPFSGFFSKELVIYYAEEAGIGPVLWLAVITAGLTAAYTLRMIIRILHLPPREEGHGHEPHEAHPIMLGPYLVLALASIILGLAWGQVSGVLSKAAQLTAAIGEAVSLQVKFAGLTYIVIGLVLASMGVVGFLYMAARVDFMGIVSRSTAARMIHDFLYDRWYINSIYYIVFVGGFTYIMLSLQLVDSLIDLLYHSAIPLLAALGAAALRTLHRGRTDYYLTLYIYFASLALLLIYLYWR
ncbi:MAG: NADH-quinone oxidoreductase subunit L [Desulfurococcales archaeon]|nr:NADH-quinone oxidoreductase subunit L [Desulfurococcales archaeon]MCE4605574.1 NADH-quinone oxidoreductase subunit L [Desulfurococcales archaeon]